jgi:hypothetical protein
VNGCVEDGWPQCSKLRWTHLKGPWGAWTPFLMMHGTCGVTTWVRASGYWLLMCPASCSTGRVMSSRTRAQILSEKIPSRTIPRSSPTRALEPLLHSPAITQALQRVHDTAGAVAAGAAIDIPQLRLPAALSASLAEAMEPLLHSPAIEESTRRIRETLGAAAAEAFPSAALRALIDQVTAQQSPLLENLLRATNTPPSGAIGPARTTPALTAAVPAQRPDRQRTTAAPRKAKAKKGKHSQAAALTSAP